jgi:hypothetical protein
MAAAGSTSEISSEDFFVPARPDRVRAAVKLNYLTSASSHVLANWRRTRGVAARPSREPICFRPMPTSRRTTSANRDAPCRRAAGFSVDLPNCSAAAAEQVVVGAGLAGLAPLLGAGLGSSLGGSSLTGSILGGLGGAAAGITGLIGLGALGIGGTAISGVLGGITGALGISLATLGPIAAIAAPALLLGAFFLGRDKRRKQAEVQRTQYITDALKQLDEVLVNVRGHKYDSGQEAIDAANSIKESYRQSANSITDTKTRNIALKEITDRIDPKIAEITAAAGQLDGARTHFNDLVPEFATGGIVPGQFGSPRLVLAHGGEIIANMSQQTPDLLNAAAKAGIPGVRGDAGSGSGSGSVNVELFVGKEMQNELFVNGAKSSKGASVLRQQNQKTSAFDDRTTSF